MRKVDEILNNQLLTIAAETAIDAGREILIVYDKGKTQVWSKEDDSPLTDADLKSHETIIARLNKTGYPVLSEESKHEIYNIRKNWTKLWLVDPLDGTKEFIKRNGEFTVNIAYIEDGLPQLGVIFVPVLNELFIGDVNIGTFKTVLPKNWRKEKISVNNLNWTELNHPCLNEEITMVVSKSHFSDETKLFVDKVEQYFNKYKSVSAGSSLKLCMVASGNAHAYPRFGPTMEWDTAAGHALIKAMGGMLLTCPEMVELRYNRENLLNPWFICLDGGEHTSSLLQLSKSMDIK